MKEQLRKELLAAGMVTKRIKKKYFHGVKFGEIRNKLQELGLDRHMPIELQSTEIALITPFGVMMQIRPLDKNQLGMWGGVIEDGETPAQGAVRELREETGIKIKEDQLEFVETNGHFHEYANGDKAYFYTHRYIVRFDYIPKITTDEESVGAFMVVHTILSHQQDFIKRVLGEI